MRRVNLTIEQSHRENNLIRRMKQTGGLVLAVICLTNGLALPGYCRNKPGATVSDLADAPALGGTPVRFKLIQNLIVTSVLVNGAGPFDFIFDTGASSTVIGSELAEELSLSSVGSTSVLTVAGSKSVRLYQLDSVALGPKSVQSITVLCTELREIHAIDTKLRGVLGQNFLSGFDFILNYSEHRIEFEEDGEFDKLLGVRLPVNRDRGRALVETQSQSREKHASKLVMDSGASSVVIFKDLARNSDLEIELDVNGGFSASTIVGRQTLSTGRLRRLQVGTEKFASLPVIVIDNYKAAEARLENGLLPTRLFRSIYINNTRNFVILNPRFPSHP